MNPEILDDKWLRKLNDISRKLGRHLVKSIDFYRAMSDNADTSNQLITRFKRNAQAY